MHLVHSTDNAQIHQSDIENCFYLEFKGNSYRLSVCNLIALKTKLMDIDLETLILSEEVGADITLLSICNSDRLMVLTIDELLELRSLFCGTLVMLELNSILHSRVYAK